MGDIESFLRSLGQMSDDLQEQLNNIRVEDEQCVGECSVLGIVKRSSFTLYFGYTRTPGQTAARASAVHECIEKWCAR
jgi:hypothetical protein